MSTPVTTVPKESRVSQNGAAPSQTDQASSTVDKLLQANTPFAVWLLFLAIGGGLLALYYARIGYLPDVEWKAALIYLFIGSMVGGAIGLLLIISLFIPGALWSEFIISDPLLERHFSYDLERKEPCIRSIIIHLGKPFVLLLLISHAMLLVGRAYIYWLLALLLLLGTFLLMRLYFERLLRNDRSKAKAQKSRVGRISRKKKIWRSLRPRRVFMARHTFKYSFWFTLSVLLSQVSMFVIYRLSGSVQISRRFFALTVLCTGVVLVSNHVVAFRHHDYPRQAVVASLVAAGLLLFTADNFSSLSVRLMNHYGMGDNERFNLLVNDHGQEIVKTLGVPDCGSRQLCNVEILSKIGDHYFLRVGDQYYVTLPKSDVVAIRHLPSELKLAQRPQN